MSQERHKKAIGVAIALGFELLSLVLICIFLGYYLGRMKDLAEIGAVVGSVIGFSIWTWRLVSTKIPLMSTPATLSREAQLFGFSILITNLVFCGVTAAFADRHTALNVFCASVFLTMNLIFYMVLAAAILVKKNIAWMGPVIVIKYLILIGSVYLVWAKCDALLVLASMFMELLTITALLVVFKLWILRRDKKHGSL